MENENLKQHPGSTGELDTHSLDNQPSTSSNSATGGMVTTSFPSAAQIWAITPSQSASLQALQQTLQPQQQPIGTLTTTTAQQPDQNQKQEQAISGEGRPQLQQKHIHQQSSHVSVNPTSQAHSDATSSGGQNGASSQSPKPPPIGSEEWHRVRRENHKQVERRRREIINDGIDEIARIVPGCEKNKGQILQRAVSYIRQLKENEAAALDKWTLEKLLTDQAINHLNRQVEELKQTIDKLSKENVHLKRLLDERDISSGKRQKRNDDPADR